MAWFQINFFAQSLSRPVNMHVLLPVEESGGADSREGFRTLYLLHGYGGSEFSWLLNAPVLELSRRFRLAIVMPEGDNGFYIDQPTSGVSFGRFAGSEIVEYTRRMFPLSRAREDTLIGGMSMGGFGALITTLKYPQTFGHCIALSAALTFDEYEDVPEINRACYKRLFGSSGRLEESGNSPRRLARELLGSGAQLPDIYLACGYNDSLSDENRDLHRLFSSIGLPHAYEEGPGSHEWPFWRRFLERGLVHALGEPPAEPVSQFTVDNYDPEFDVIGRAD